MTFRWACRVSLTMCFAALCVLLLLLDCIAAESSAVVPIVIDDNRPREVAAAADLADFLAKLYPETKFEVRSTVSGSELAPAIFVGSKESQAKLLGDEMQGKLDAPGSFVVFRRRVDGRPSGCIVGADVAGLRQGVYRLLKQLGCGFYFGTDILPERLSDERPFAARLLHRLPLQRAWLGRRPVVRPRNSACARRSRTNHAAGRPRRFGRIAAGRPIARGSNKSAKQHAGQALATPQLAYAAHDG